MHRGRAVVCCPSCRRADTCAPPTFHWRRAGGPRSCAGIAHGRWPRRRPLVAAAVPEPPRRRAARASRGCAGVRARGSVARIAGSDWVFGAAAVRFLRVEDSVECIVRLYCDPAISHRALPGATTLRGAQQRARASGTVEVQAGDCCVIMLTSAGELSQVGAGKVRFAQDVKCTLRMYIVAD